MNIKILHICLSITLLFILHCSEDRITGNYSNDSESTGSLIKYSGCKEFQSVNHTNGTLSNKDCIEYQYGGENVLLIKHVNAGFNCCPDEILAEIHVRGNKIVIEEKEDLMLPCPCLCLYDLDYEITNLKPGKYEIKVIEPYVIEGEDILETSLDLYSSTSGSFCVERIHYPWNHDTVDTTMGGRLIGYAGCKESDSHFEGRCIVYQYLWDNLLLIKQTDVTLNCCPISIEAHAFIEGNVITVGVERDTGRCFCLCKYDLDYEIINVEPIEYTIKAWEPNNEPFEFNVDLSSSTSGFYCIDK